MQRSKLDALIYFNARVDHRSRGQLKLVVYLKLNKQRNFKYMRNVTLLKLKLLFDSAKGYLCSTSHLNNDFKLNKIIKPILDYVFFCLIQFI